MWLNVRSENHFVTSFISQWERFTAYKIVPADVLETGFSAGFYITLGYLHFKWKRWRKWVLLIWESFNLLYHKWSFCLKQEVILFFSFSLRILFTPLLALKPWDRPVVDRQKQQQIPVVSVWQKRQSVESSAGTTLHSNEPHNSN